jgi:[ribosomal protein S5]-alanine N-acetyltransferase
VILLDRDNSDIELVWYGDLHDNKALKKDYLSWLNDYQITHLIGSHSLNRTNGLDFVEDSFRRFTQPNCIGFFIRYVPDDRFIGTAKLDSISRYTRSATDGIMIGDKVYHGRGVAVSVYRLLLAYAFGELDLHRVNGGCNEDNVAMIKTFLKIGYLQEGRLRHADWINNTFSDHLWFGILKDEFYCRHDVVLRNK